MKSNILRFKSIGLLALPVIALIVALLVINLGQQFTTKAQANTGHTGLDFSISANGCVANPAAKCMVPLGSSVALGINLVNNGTAPDGAVTYQGYAGVFTLNAAPNVTFVTDKTCTDPNSVNFPCAAVQVPAHARAGETVWPGCSNENFATGLVAGPAVPPNSWAVGCAGTNSTYTGTLAVVNIMCNPLTGGAAPPPQIIELLNGPGLTSITDGASVEHSEAGNDTLTINCVAATNTPLPTATPTVPPIPRVFKTCSAAGATVCNVFLTRQGLKIPPATCAAGTDAILLNEQINIPISTISPKGDAQSLGAFQFEVRYDSKDVCVFLKGAGDFVSTNANVICTVRDDSNSTLKGIAQIGCITIGKGHTGTNLNLATITVKPQPEVYSQLRPNQSNGVPVQILNQGCNLADEQGIAIPIFSCEDADLTFRFLEGDVDGPDCDVDVLDAQQVAFRWGANKGNLLFNSFMDLSPSGHGVNGDGHIDIQDIQFVFGRFGSTGTAQKGSTGPCLPVGNPWPPQPPVNPKA